MKTASAWLVVLVSLFPLACSKDSGTGPSGDTRPPSAVTDLRVLSIRPETVTLAWTAPGDDDLQGTAARYDIRYAMLPVTAATWDSATPSTRELVPKLSGSEERCTLNRLRSGTYYFAVRAADEVPNWSGLSNSPTAAVPAAAVSLPVTDLAVDSIGPGSIRLIWTAPGDGINQVRALEYDLRYAQNIITSETWGEAFRVPELPAPASFATPEGFTVTGLGPWTTYHFGLRAANVEHMWSALSNVVSATTGAVSYQRLTSSTRIVGATYPDWSPDGRKIAFGADWLDQAQDAIYVQSLDEERATRLTGSLGQFTLAKPAWSPDGKRIAFTEHHTEGLDDVYELKVINASPGALATVVATHRNARGIGSPSWSPNGLRIAYDVRTYWLPPDVVSEIYTVPATGGSPTLLVSAAINGSSPAWSPDGTKIAFGSSQTPRGIYTIPATGGEPTLLASGPSAMGTPAWSRDGTRIAYTSAGDIWIMSSTGENPTRLTLGPEPETTPSWSPDGRALCVGRSINFVSDIWILRL
jgi:Tol biopolymer transport system component